MNRILNLQETAYTTTVPASETEVFLAHVQHMADQIIDEIREQYLEDSIPWVVGFSGGKDSTTVLQLIFHALNKLPPSKLAKEIHVLSNDTLVENPNVVKFLDEQLDRIRSAGKNQLFAHNQHMITNGEEWMLPLNEFRDWLHEIRDDETKRDKVRRTDQPGLGLFTKEIRKEILERLLKIECEVGYEFITKPELIAIQHQWNYDGNFRYSVAEIYSEMKGNDIMVPEEQMSERRSEEFEILEQVCKDHEIDPNHIKELMELEREHLSFLRRHNIFEDMKSKIARFVTERESSK